MIEKSEIKKKITSYKGKTRDMMLTLVIRIWSGECGVLKARGFDNHSGFLVNEFFFLNLRASWAYITICDCTTSSITADHVSFKIKCETLVLVRWGFFQEYLGLYHSQRVGDNNEYNFHHFVFWLQDWSKYFQFANHNGYSLCRIGIY